MTIVLTGGGSGGHITPIIALSKKIKQKQPYCRIVYIGQIGDKFVDQIKQTKSIDRIYSIRAGKFRRYHNEGIRQLLDIETILKNIRDVFYVIFGIYQSWKLLRSIKPHVVFCRGGYVSVPVALGAKLNHIPYVTHDSDLIPNLANRLISRWARLHAVTFPDAEYPYPKDKIIVTGIPLNEKFEPITLHTKLKYKKDLDFPPQSKVLFIIGGGHGSQNINDIVCEISPHILSEFPDLYIIHIAGQANESKVSDYYKKRLNNTDIDRVCVLGFINDVYRYSATADIVITRAGATNLAEFAIQGMACIVIPSAFLVGGHQLVNADYLYRHKAAIVLSEKDLLVDPNRLAKNVSELLKNNKHRQELSTNLASLAQPEAASKLAEIILSI